MRSSSGAQHRICTFRSETFGTGRYRGDTAPGSVSESATYHSTVMKPRLT